jgi:hypothetical protein
MTRLQKSLLYDLNTTSLELRSALYDMYGSKEMTTTTNPNGTTSFLTTAGHCNQTPTARIERDMSLTIPS